MAKLSVTLRNDKRVKMAKMQDALRKELRKKSIDFDLPDEEREAARTKLHELPRDGARIRVRNRCQATGRSRGVYKKFMLSRICFREMASQGLIPGVTKASW